ncbi:MAG: endonuclease domain-containing protein [Parvibaculum sp.]
MPRRLIKRARTLRTNQTDAEARLWSRLRNRSLGGFKFRRQIAVDPFIADFLCSESMLIVELDGGQHDEQAAADARRTAYLEGLGYCVLRFWNNDVLANTEGVLEVILGELQNTRPSPNPLPEGEG